MKNRAVFLDRDGVINALHYDENHGLIDSPLNISQVSILPGVADAIKLLNSAGFLVAIISNQPGIAKKKMKPEELEAITTYILQELSKEGARISKVYYCLHHPEAKDLRYRIFCNCRKPSPGLLLQASEELQIDLVRSIMIGDGLVDIEAGKSAGCQTVWIGKKKCDICQVMKIKDLDPDFIAANLLEAANIILSMEVRT